MALGRKPLACVECGSTFCDHGEYMINCPISAVIEAITKAIDAVDFETILYKCITKEYNVGKRAANIKMDSGRFINAVRRDITSNIVDGLRMGARK